MSDTTSIILPSGGDSGPKRRPTNAPKKRRRRSRAHFWLSAIMILVVTGLVVGAVGSLVAYLYAKPRYELAKEFDLDDVYDLETASIIYDRHGDELGRIFVLNRQPISIQQVPDHFIDSLVAAEDGRFFEHDGVDYMGVIRAVLLNFQAGEVNQGASTITQQLARNTFELRERSISRKVVEMFLAQRLERRFEKKEILELYLNRIYFGSGYYGIAAASEGYFGKKPQDLTIPESAAICGLIKSPNRYSPHNNPEQSKITRDNVLRRMVDEDFITKEERDAFQAEPVRPIAKGSVFGRSKYAYERVRQRVIDLVGYEEAQEGGFRIYTTIDNRIQDTAEASLKRQLDLIEGRPGYKHQNYAVYKSIRKNFLEQNEGKEGVEAPSPEYLQGAALMIDNHTGGIIAMVGGRNFADSMFDRTFQGRRPVGTAFTPFVYATAFTKGAFPGTLVDDSPIDGKRVQIGGLAGILGEWGVETLKNPYEGEITARAALAKGKNSATVRLGENVGVSNVVDLAKKAGIRFSGTLQDYNATLLGRNEASMTELALAYTIFPNGGRKPSATHVISSIRDSAGKERYSVNPGLESEAVVDPYTAYQITSTLTDVLKKGTGVKAYEMYGLKDFPAAGKTGTEYGFTDNWFVGYTSEVTCVVWAGFDQTQEIYPGAFSNDTVLPVWVETMNAAAETFEPVAFTPPADAVEAEICTVTGQLATDACYEQQPLPNGTSKQVRSTYIEYLRPGTEISTQCRYHQGGERPRTGRILRPDDRLTMNSGGPMRARPIADSIADPVIPIGPTILGSDPYQSIMPAARKTVIAVPITEEEEEEEEEEEKESEATDRPAEARDEESDRDSPPATMRPIAVPITPEVGEEIAPFEPAAASRPVATPIIATPIQDEPMEVETPAEKRIRLSRPRPIEFE